MEDLEKWFGNHLRLSECEQGGIRIEAGDGIDLMHAGFTFLFGSKGSDF